MAADDADTEGTEGEDGRGGEVGRWLWLLEVRRRLVLPQTVVLIASSDTALRAGIPAGKRERVRQQSSNAGRTSSQSPLTPLSSPPTILLK